MEREEDENTRTKLDQDFDSIRDILFTDAGPSSTGSNAVPLGRSRPTSTQDAPNVEQEDYEYDQFVREIVFDKRAKPKDRTKTEEELALEVKEALENAERARIRRMMGIEDDSEEEDATRKGRKRKWERGGDDLEDDFVAGDDEDVLATIGAGLTREDEQENDDDDDEGVSSMDNDASASDSSNEDQEDSDGDSEGDDESTMRNYKDRMNDALPPSQKRSKKGKEPAKVENLPFTFPCPASHEEFLSILEMVDDGDVPTVVQRIRSLHHPSLNKDNPAKLQVCYLA